MRSIVERVTDWIHDLYTDVIDTQKLMIISFIGLYRYFCLRNLVGSWNLYHPCRIYNNLDTLRVTFYKMSNGLDSRFTVVIDSPFIVVIVAFAD